MSCLLKPKRSFHSSDVAGRPEHNVEMDNGIVIPPHPASVLRVYVGILASRLNVTHCWHHGCKLSYKTCSYVQLFVKAA